VDLLLKETLRLGARLAKPGEFSERAFLNGKLDLVQAEAIADIIESHSESALRSSIRSLNGEFSKEINALIESVTHLRIYVEAAIDFPEEEVDFVSDSFINQSLDEIVRKTELNFNHAKSGSVINEGLNVVILGKPNAGKSSLLNALAANDIAIVTNLEGTTRDTLKEHIILDDIPLTLIDTAGLRDSNDPIELEGIKRISKVTESADIILFLRDCSNDGESFDSNELKELIGNHNIKIAPSALQLVINNKIDKIDKEPSVNFVNELTVLSISAKNRQGINLLAEQIKKHYGISNSNENTFTARRRHLTQLEIALDYLRQGKTQLESLQAAELLAEDLRQVQNALGEITGKVSSDDLLGKIFSSFCIGK
jgi:tRNA modification GTPase